MKTKKKRNIPAGDRVKRLSFPEDEKKHPWLSLILEGYHIVDRGIAKAIGAEKRKGIKLACSKGCSFCCGTHKDIPVYPLELKVIIWYTVEKMKGAERDVLKEQLDRFTKDGPCPFLIEGSCSVHPVRPMACRQFNVFGRPCAEGEDPYYTRREDVMDPVKKYVDQAFFIMLPFYGVEKETEKINIIETGRFHRMVKGLHECNWKELAGKMERQDSREVRKQVN